MSGDASHEFGRRSPVVQPEAPVKRSGHVALFLMGTIALGGGAYAMMPRDSCDPSRAGIAVDPGQAKDCSPRQSSFSSGGGHVASGSGSSSRLGFFGGDSSPGQSGDSASDAGHVTRGGFGSFAQAFAAHFSGGG
jgi:hypothetical protein